MEKDTERTVSNEELLRKSVALSGGMPGGPLSPSARITPIDTGGSDREFFRVWDGSRSAVLLLDRSGELASYTTIGSFLAECGAPVPAFYGTDGREGMVLMEDLGSIHLEDELGGALFEQELSLYRSALELLATLQSEITARMLERGLLEERRFDEQVLLGETDYFRKQFIERHCRIPLDEGWERERRRLAELLSKQHVVFMHRDFQSRNIMIKDGRLRLVDFQTAHRGPGLYDLASLLRDPYHPLPFETARLLAGEFHELMRERSAYTEIPFERFYEGFVLAGIQRNLQALAAFVKLGKTKEKKGFLEAIPAGLDLLEAGIDESGRFPAMKRMVIAVREQLEKGT